MLRADMPADMFVSRWRASDAHFSLPPLPRRRLSSSITSPRHASYRFLRHTDAMPPRRSRHDIDTR